MTFSRLARWCAVAILLCLTGGCLPAGNSPLDEQKEPHFLTGKNRVNAMDFAGAIESYETALEINPRSASAHFELGWLYEEKVNDYAAAIYHYDRFLKLRPTAGNADLVKSRVNRCKAELARNVSALPTASQDVQHELTNLAQQNQDLKAEVARWQNWYSANYRGQASPVTSAAPNPTPPANPTPPPAPTSTVDNGRTVSTPPANPVPPAATRTHVVKAGDSPYSIARRYGITVSALLAANPQVRATHLRVGQTL